MFVVSKYQKTLEVILSIGQVVREHELLTRLCTQYALAYPYWPEQIQQSQYGWASAYCVHHLVRSSCSQTAWSIVKITSSVFSQTDTSLAQFLRDS